MGLQPMLDRKHGSDRSILQHSLAQPVLTVPLVMGFGTG